MTDTTLFASKSAQELLAEFNATGRQQPFEEIVRRYAGMVYNVCLRVTKNAHDAEDATQAVFLALAAQGRTGKPVRYIGPWLQQVGRRLSLDIRRSRKRRTRREEIVGEMHRENGNGNGHGGNGVASCPSDHLSQVELRTMLTEELNQLPSKYRLPLILHYFGGLSRDEMAKELGVKANTLGVRVCRGRDMLAKRLATRGVTIGAAALAVLLAETIRETVADTLIASTCHAAAHYAAANGARDVASSVVSTQVVALADSVARALLLAKVKGVTALVLMLCTAVAGGAEAVGRVRDLNLPLNLSSELVNQIRSLLRNVTRPIRLTGATPGETIQTDLTDSDLLGDVHGGAPFYASLDHDAAAARAPVTAAAMTAVSVTHQAAGMPQTWSLGGANFPAGPIRSQTLTDVVSAPVPVVAVAPPVAASPRVVPPRPAPAAPRATLASATPSNVAVDGPRNAGATRRLAHGQSMAPQNLTVGDRGDATFHQSGGTNHIADQLVLGARRGSSGTYRLDDGELSAREQIVGKGGKGKVEQTGGTNTVKETVYVGFDKGSEGTYALSGDGTLLAGNLYVPKDGTGTFAQTGGTTVLTGTTHAAADLVIASDPGSTGTYHLSNGSLQADHQVIGHAGDGHFVQFGGVNDVAIVDLGSAADGSGEYVFKSGTIRLDNVAMEAADDSSPATPVRPTIRIGGAGDGTFQLGSINKRATIVDLHGATGLTVRGAESASGEFRGWGVVGLNGPFVNNGKVIADGFGTPRALDFTAASSVSNAIENPIEGASGWFARRGGRLLLPPIAVRNGSHEYTWGEDAADESLDLVNSVRVRLTGVTNPGDVRIALLALDRPDLPELPGGHNFIGAWSFDAGEAVFGHVGLTIRYDEALADAMHLDENVLKLWRYGNGAWERIADDSFGRDVEQNLVWGRTDSVTYFAVSAPEPSCVGAIVLTGWALMRRVRRSSSLSR